MSNGIQPLRPGAANPYLQTTAARTPFPASQRSEAAPDRFAPAVADARAAVHDLTQDERAMVEALFPDSEASRLRLYGPTGSEREVAPGVIGSRLDMRG